MSSEQDKLTDHEYDGIRELDNRLPEWWLFIFAATIIFAFIYWVHYEIAGGPSSDQELAQALEALKGSQKQGPLLGEDKLAALFSQETTTAGAPLFAEKCAVCHGPQGGGVIGPNLTDRFWLNGRATRADIYRLVAEGVPAKGMPAWQDLMSEKDLVAVASFVHALKGTEVKNGKEPQGVEVK